MPSLPFRRKRTVHQRLGRRGENLAARLLCAKGMTLLARNYHGPHGELDLVARDGCCLVFVEVKTMHRTDRGRPIDRLGAEQRARIIRTARRYRLELGSPRIPYRYDVVEVVYNGRRLVEIRHWPAEYGEADIVRTASGRHIDRRQHPGR